MNIRYKVTVIWFIFIFFLLITSLYAEQTASWYSIESCRKEGSSGIMSNGRRLDNEVFTCASWDYVFGTYLLVTNINNGRSIVVIVSDRGPAKRLYKKGRVLDLSKAAFKKIASLKEGIIRVKIQRIN